MKLLIFGGTTEGRVLAERAAALGAEVTVSVATPLGAEELAGLDGVRGRHSPLREDRHRRGAGSL